MQFQDTHGTTMLANTPGSSAQIIEGLRRNCEELLSPLTHNDVAKLSELLLSILSAAGILGFEDLRSATQCTLWKVHEYDYNLAKHQYAVNMWERSRWILHELQCALKDPVPLEGLRAERVQLECSPFELCELNQSQWDLASKRQAVGGFRRALREARYTTEVLLQELPSASLGNRLDNVAQLARALTSAMSGIFDALTDAEGHTSPKPRLHNFQSPLKAHCSVLTERIRPPSRVRGRAAEGSNATVVADTVLRLNDLLSRFEVESRSEFSQELGSRIQEGAHRSVSIHEDVGAPRLERLQSVCDMMSEWIIDTELARPQYGFGRAQTIEELQSYLTTHRGRLFRAVACGNEVGYYLLFHDSNHFPPEVASIMQSAHDAGEYTSVVQGWLQLVGITKAGREWAKDSGVDLYSMLHEAAVDTLASFQVEKVFAVVREGTYANLAKSSHLSRGWRETGVMTQLGRFPYQVIRLELSPGGNW